MTRPVQLLILSRCLPAAVLLLSALQVQAQQQDTVLKEVRVRGRHRVSADTRLNDFATGQQVQTLDSAVLSLPGNQSMATVLSQRLPVFVKAYAFSGLATVAFRGSSAAQSQVLWNGVPIQNAALGVADISAIPATLINRAHVVYGSSAALSGSGNVGGALMLEQEPARFDTGLRQLSVSAATGSYGQNTGAVKGAIASRRWYLQAGVTGQSAANNYSYTATDGSRQHMPNSRVQSGSLMTHAAWRPNKHNTLDLWLWAQQYDRQIPPALFEALSRKEQQDNALRGVALWQHYTRKGGMLYARTSVIRDGYTYTDEAINLRTTGAVMQYYQEVGWRQHVGRNGKVLLFAPVQLSWLPAGADSQHQYRTALAGAYTLQLPAVRTEISVQARGERINDQNIFLPGAGATFAATRWLSLRANAQKTYRAPSLNELYYFPGGNASLKPEEGWSADGGYTIGAGTGRWQLQHEASVFDRSISNWILWLGGAVWTPHNIARVHSRGTETSTRIAYTAQHWRLGLHVATSYVLASTTESYIPQDGSTGRQIPYTPRYNGRVQLWAGWKQLELQYLHSYTGYRYITTDESAWLEPYNTGNITLSWHTDLRHRRVGLYAYCNNVWNVRYAVAAYRPMPGTNWMAGCNVAL